jgi:hypothetical protein
VRIFKNEKSYKCTHKTTLKQLQVMKNFTMMLLLATALLAGCKKEDEVSPYISIYVRPNKVVYDNYGKSSLSSGLAEVGTTVYIYKDLAGYLSNQPVATTLSSADYGYALFKLDRTMFPNVDSLYVRAVKDNFNSERYYNSNTFSYRKLENRNPTLYFSSKETYNYLPVSDITISTTPTKLRLQVFDAGVKANNYNVYFYTTEAGYLSGLSGVLGGTVAVATTDVNGEVELKDLEPRQYWFRVSGIKNNSTTTFKTPQALPDDANITTIVQVAIK